MELRSSAPHLVVLFDENLTAYERRTRLYRELDERRSFWPFPPAQPEWLKSLLNNCRKDFLLNIDPEDTEEPPSPEGHEEYSFWDSVKRYLKDDFYRELFDQWESTGVIFDAMQLSWQDCFFHALLTAERYLLGETSPPFEMTVEDFDIQYYH